MLEYHDSTFLVQVLQYCEITDLSNYSWEMLMDMPWLLTVCASTQSSLDKHTVCLYYPFIHQLFHWNFIFFANE